MARLRQSLDGYAEAEALKAARAAAGDHTATVANLTAMAARDAILHQALVKIAIDRLSTGAGKMFQDIARTGGLYRAVHDDGGADHD